MTTGVVATPACALRTRTATTDSIAQRVREAQQGVATTPVVISADKNVKYDAVVTVMGKLQQGGVQRVGLSVKNAGK